MTVEKATKERVFAACQKIASEGQPITQVKVYRELNCEGSMGTIRKHIKEWNEREDNDIPIKSYSMPDAIKKEYDRIGQEHWNAFLRFYLPINDNEIITELEKKIEFLEAQVELKNRDSIVLNEIKPMYDKLIEQGRDDVAQIKFLTIQVDFLGKQLEEYKNQAKENKNEN